MSNPRAPWSPRATSTLYGAASLLANFLGYLFLVALSRVLGPAEYGAAGALLGVGVIGSILSVSLQLVVARAVSADSSGGSTTSARFAISLAAATTIVAWACTPAVMHYLHLSSPWPSIWVGATLAPMTVAGALMGHLLGRQNFVRLAVATVMVSAARLVAALVTAVAGWGLTGALASLTVATAGATVLLARLADVPQWWRDTHAMWRRDLVDVARAAERVAAFLVLTNLDVLLARHYLPAHEAGIYAFGSLFAKAGLWGPQFFAVVAFPRLAASPSPTRLYLATAGATAVFGAALVGAATLVAEPLIRALSGEEFVAAAAYAPGFALLGTAFALVNLSLVASVAVREGLFGVATWLCALVQVVVVSAWRHDSIGQVLTACTVIAVCTAAVGGLLTLTRRPGAAGALPPEVPTPGAAALLG
ncbi:MAG: hypothetical protein ABI807_11800 [Sporichthyaceae bacterium]